MSFQVRLTLEAADDLERLFDFVVQRELMRPEGDVDLAEHQTAAFTGRTAVLAPHPDHLSHSTQEKSPLFDICNNAPSFSPERGLV